MQVIELCSAAPTGASAKPHIGLRFCRAGHGRPLSGAVTKIAPRQRDRSEAAKGVVCSAQRRVIALRRMRSFVSAMPVAFAFDGRAP